MAKKKMASTDALNDDVFEDSEDSFYESLATKNNGDVLSNIDSISYFVDTGSLALNYICSGRFMGGGVPGGKLTEIYGPNSSCKSLLGANILFGCQRSKGVAVLMDCENSANKEFIQQASHCNLKRIIRFTPQSLEAVFSKMYSIIKGIRETKANSVPIVILYDSIGVSPSERELKEINLPEKYTQAEFKRIVGRLEQPGERAKICSRELRKLNTIMEKNNATVVILNQTRDAIGKFSPMGTPKTTAGGGNALPFYASCRLETKTQIKIEKKIVDKKKKIMGINVKLKNVKNKTHRPHIESENIQLLFDRGINPLSGLLTCLMDSDRDLSGKETGPRIQSSGKGSFTVNPAYSGGKEYKFKASVTQNSIPIQVVLDCPYLIDAESAEQVQDYLNPFMESILFDISADPNIEANNADEDDDEFIDEELFGDEDSEDE
jgi:RecA/RadA recombinase